VFKTGDESLVYEAYSPPVKIKRNKFKRISDYKIYLGDLKLWPKEKNFFKNGGKNTFDKEMRIYKIFDEIQNSS
jgi:hypothetical protein